MDARPARMERRRVRKEGEEEEEDGGVGRIGDGWSKGAGRGRGATVESSA